MRKSLSLMFCCLLAGCQSLFRDSISDFREESHDAPGLKFPFQDSAPLPWIAILPSDRAVNMKNVDFFNIARQMRHDMKFPPYENKFSNVTLVLLDYGIEKSPTTALDRLIIKEKGTSYSRGYKEKEDKYVMRAEFYCFQNCPPSPPCFEESIVLDMDKAAPSEAMKLMAHEIILDHLASPLRKLTVNLD